MALTPVPSATQSLLSASHESTIHLTNITTPSSLKSITYPSTTHPTRNPTLPSTTDDTQVGPEWLSRMQNNLNQIQQLRLSNPLDPSLTGIESYYAFLSKQKADDEARSWKLQKICEAPLADVVKSVTRAHSSIVDVENLWLRILHDSQVPVGEVEIEYLDGGDAPAQYRALNFWRRERMGLVASIHIFHGYRRKNFEQWFEGIKQYLDQLGVESVLCVLAVGGRAWCRRYERMSELKMDTTRAFMDGAWEEGGHECLGDVDLVEKWGWGMYYAQDFLERGFRRAGDEDEDDYTDDDEGGEELEAKTKELEKLEAELAELRKGKTKMTSVGSVEKARMYAGSTVETSEDATI